MIHFVVVEDNLNDREKVKKIISKVSFNTEEEIDIKYYTHYDEKLKDEIKATKGKKIYILDVELKTGTSGIEVADKIRKMDWNSEIIFVSSHEKMFEIAHRSIYNVFSFIEKFHKFEETLEKDLKAIISYNFDNKMFKYSSRSAQLAIYFRRILYIYRDTNERRLYIITDANKYVVTMTLHEMLDKLDDRFKICHRGSIVNTSRVENYDYKKSTVTFDNGEVSPYLSKKYRKDLEK